MKVFFVFLAIIINQEAIAAGLSQLKGVRCINDQGSHLNIKVEQNLITAQFREFPFLSSEYVQEKQDLTKYTWTPGKLYGFGGLVGSRDEKFMGLVTLLFEAPQESNLPENDIYRVHYADPYGRTTLEEMDCHLTFLTH